MTTDFIEDAMDVLQSDDDMHYLLIATANRGRTTHHAYHIESIDQLNWFRDRFNAWYKRVERDLSS